MHNIAYCFDNNYRQHFAAAICSLIENYTSEELLTINIVSDKLDDDFIENIKKINKKSNISLLWFDVGQITHGLPVPSGMHFSSAIYLRLYLPMLLSSSVKKVLYLDSDTICMTDISPLLKIEMNNHLVAGVLDPQHIIESQRVNVKNYINSGVILMNLDLWRAEKIAEKCIDWIEAQPAISLGDQDAINVICKKRIKIIDLAWNATINLERSIAFKHAKILHYISGNKPWHSWYSAVLAEPYFSYLKLTAWANASLTPPKTVNQALLFARKHRSEGSDERAFQAYENLVAELVQHIELLTSKNVTKSQPVKVAQSEISIATNNGNASIRNEKLIGYFINLTNSSKRREAFEAQLNTLNFDWPISRFSAMTGDNRPSKLKGGELGCFLSHQSIINSHNSNTSLAIFEDDVILLPESKELISEILRKLNDDVDIIFLGCGVDYANVNKISDLIKLKKQHIPHHANGRSISLLDARDYYNHGAHAYIVKHSSIEKIKNIINESAASGYQTPIDDLFRINISSGIINAVVVFPYLVQLDMNFDTTISTRAHVPNSSGYESLYSASANIFSINSRNIDMLEWANSQLDPQTFDIDCFAASQIIYKRFRMDSIS